MSSWRLTFVILLLWLLFCEIKTGTLYNAQNNGEQMDLLGLNLSDLSRWTESTNLETGTFKNQEPKLSCKTNRFLFLFNKIKTQMNNYITNEIRGQMRNSFKWKIIHFYCAGFYGRFLWSNFLSSQVCFVLSFSIEST